MNHETCCLSGNVLELGKEMQVLTSSVQTHSMEDFTVDTWLHNLEVTMDAQMHNWTRAFVTDIWMQNGNRMRLFWVGLFVFIIHI